MKLLKKILSLMLCLTQIITPELVRATALVDDTNLVQPHNFFSGFLKEPKLTTPKALHSQLFHSVTPDREGAFRLTFDPLLFKKDLRLYLEHKSTIVGMVSYENDILRLIGANQHSFVIEG